MILGTGILTWDGSERRSDRYGTVWLMNDGHNSMTVCDPGWRLDDSAVSRAIGQKGRLVARVLSARQSTHIGDLFRGIFPVTPDEGEDIDLGSGQLFSEQQHFGPAVGLRPDDGRRSDWLNPENLYRAHEQLVELRFEAVQ